MMQTQRTILWVIFVMSLVFLWDNWQRYNGQPSLFGGPPPASREQSAPGQEGAAGGTGATPGAAADGSVPTAPPPTAGTGQAATPAPGAPASVAPAAQLVRLSNDVLQVDIDTMG